MPNDKNNIEMVSGGVTSNSRPVVVISPSTSLTSPTSLDNMVVGVSTDSLQQIVSPPNSPSNMLTKKDSTYKSTGTKSLPSSMKTPLSSSVTKFHNKVFKIRTCCGIFELNCLKVTSILALSISLFAFCCLVVTISINYAIVTTLYSNIELMQTDATYYRELMKMSCRVAATTDYNRTLALEYSEQFNYNYNKYYEIINNLIATLPDEAIYYKKFNIPREDLLSRVAVKVELAAMDLVVTHANYTAALELINSPYYEYLLSGYNDEVKSVLDYANEMKESSASSDLITTTVALVVICASLVVVIPVITSFVCLSLKKDTSKEKQLRQVKKYMLMDTINDSALNERFKEFCKQERSEENYAILDKINDYKRLCQKSFEIQVFLYDTDVLSGSDQASETTTSSTEDSSKRKKKKGFTEKDLDEIEKKKFEIAFEIFTDFLDVRGDHSVNISKQFADNVKRFLDHFAKGENEQLPENLFDQVESEMCVLMMDTHHRFKLHLEIELKERKKIISTIKRKR